MIKKSVAGESGRNFYEPVQPAPKLMAEKVLYREVLPHPELRDLVYCYWELKTVSALEAPFLYRVVADGCIDIFFPLNSPTDSAVMGFCNQYVEFPLDKIFHYVGIRFLPAMLPAVLNFEATALSNRTEALDVVSPETSAFISSQLQAEDDLATIKEKFDGYLLRLCSRVVPKIDPRFRHALSIILAKPGALNLEKDLEPVGLSARQLRRYFERYIGDTPKSFSKVVRFQKILRAKPSVQSLRANKIFFDHGYYDQAHFIKEFKEFYGLTPTRALG